MIGQALGHYKLEEQLGAGGMGVVYRATDSQLGRQVAIKVLPEKFAGDPELLARFAREARMLASLSHPNIAAIHGLEESQGVRYLVLELVPGETLAKRVKRGPLGIREAITVGRQIAEALEAAHDKGIIHRDLKPANVNITPQDKVKVLDFGLAKAFQTEVADSDVSQSPTVTSDDTRTSVVLGTAAYMSPEQARGKPLDKRSDIWSFGCVMYELLAARKAFPGETITDCVAAVLGKEPDWEALPSDTPPQLRTLLRRCLRKDPQSRLRDIGDARIELEELVAAPAREDTDRKQTAITRRTAISALSGAAAGAAATFSLETGRKKVLVEGGTHPRYSPTGHILYARDAKIFAIRFDAKGLETMGQPFPVLEGVLMSRNTGAANYDVSASGDLAYIPGICDGGARTLVWVDRNGRAEALPLAAKSYLHPRLSPDDRRLAIEIEGTSHDLYVYDFDRGVLANITTDGVSHWPVWSPDGTQLAYRSGPMARFRLWRVPADRSRPPQQVPATGVSQSAESWSPDGRAIAYTAVALGAPPSIMVAHLDESHQAQSFPNGRAPEGSAKFSPDGRWLAYCSNEPGKPQVYVQAFPGPGPKIQISTDGGTDPTWKRTGGELYYRNGDSMMTVVVSTASAFLAGRPKELWTGHYSHGMSSSCGAPGATSSNYDVSADGKRFLMIKDDDQDRATSKQIVVVQAWADELSRLSAKA